MRCVAHPDVDGRGMVRSSVDDPTITRVGAAFAMNMFYDEMGDDVTANHVVEFESDRCIVWEPVMRSIDTPEFQSDVGVPALHEWDWELESLDAEHTKVTEFFDCGRSPAWLRRAVKEGERWRPEIEASLANLERLVTS